MSARRGNVLIRLARARRGSSAVEFALVVVPLFTLVFGIVEFGRLLWTRDVIKQVATVGARCMGLPQPNCSVGTPGAYDAKQAQVFMLSEAKAFSVGLTPSALTLDRASGCASSAGVSNSSQVTINLTFTTSVPLIVKALATPELLTVVGCFPNQS